MRLGTQYALLTSLLLLSACGGGSSGSSTSDKPINSNDSPDPIIVTDTVTTDTVTTDTVTTDTVTTDTVTTDTVTTDTVTTDTVTTDTVTTDTVTTDTVTTDTVTTNTVTTDTVTTDTVTTDTVTTDTVTTDTVTTDTVTTDTVTTDTVTTDTVTTDTVTTDTVTTDTVSTNTVSNTPPNITPLEVQLVLLGEENTILLEVEDDSSTLTYSVSEAPLGQTRINDAEVYYQLNNLLLLDGVQDTFIVTVFDGEYTVTEQVTVEVSQQDVLFNKQWHLINAMNEGEDINIAPIWRECDLTEGCRGEGINIVVVDSGVQSEHEDLSENFSYALSHNYIDGSNNPTPSGITDPGVAHGTAVAGLIAGRDMNTLGVKGSAPRATLASYNLLDFNFSDFDAVDAMRRNAEDAIHISNNSWGFPDCDGVYNSIPAFWDEVTKAGTLEGRGGKGVAYFWAAGNGGICPDEFGEVSSNYDLSVQDGLANSLWVLPVTALDNEGKVAVYGELGSNILLSSYGGNFCDTLALVTTDLEISDNGGFNDGTQETDLDDENYTQCMNGTSGATPIAAGVAALVLQANEELSARDLRMILATTARQNDAESVSWRINDAGLAFSEIYGFGAIDAEAAVGAAKSWELLPALKSHTVTISPNYLIPDNADAESQEITVVNSEITVIEYLQLHVQSPDHTYIGDLSVILRKGDTSSILAFPNQDSSTGLDWPYTTTHFLNMSADGTWSVTVRDNGAIDTGTLTTLTLTVYGH